MFRLHVTIFRAYSWPWTWGSLLTGLWGAENRTQVIHFQDVHLPHYTVSPAVVYSTAYWGPSRTRDASKMTSCIARKEDRKETASHYPSYSSWNKTKQEAKNSSPLWVLSYSSLQICFLSLFCSQEWVSARLNNAAFYKSVSLSRLHSIPHFTTLPSIMAAS